MVVVEFEYKEMKKLIDIPKDDMIDGLSSLGAPCEFEPETKKIIAELTPNRPDWYSMEGLARALKAYYKKTQPKYSVKKSDYKVIVDPSVAKVRPYTVCGVVRGLEFDDQRIKDVVLLQEKLLGTLGRRVKRFGIGVYPLHAIKFPLKYTTMKPEEIRYRPLGHEKEMSATQILEEHKKGKQYGHLIKEFERYPVFTDADGKIMCLIPIVNSAETGKVDEKTKDVFLEVSGTDMHACKAALNILVCTFSDMGGQPYEVLMDYEHGKFHAPDLSEKKMKLDLEEVSRILGLEVTEKMAKELLARMGYAYSKGEVLIPPYRADIISAIDVVEDIAIAYGYNNFEFTLPDFFSPGERIDPNEEADRVMRGMGFSEIKTFILTNKEKLAAVGHGGRVVEISNPNNVEYTVVRPTLTADILEVFSNNKMKGLPQKFYEFGLVQHKETRRNLIFGIMDKEVKFSDARGYLQTLAREIGLKLALEKTLHPLFEEETSCVVLDGEKEIGIFGKVNKKALEKFGLGFDVYVCELRL
jgi:phenylalanyl-tRNA synthetase beta chain